MMYRQLLHLMNVMYLSNGGMMAEQKPLWNHERIFRRMNEIIDEHEKSGKPAIAALHSCNDLAYMVMYDCNAAIAERDAEIERLRAALAQTWQPMQPQAIACACRSDCKDSAVLWDDNHLQVINYKLDRYADMILPDDVRLCRKVTL